MGVSVSFTVNTCVDCDHPWYLINFNYSICNHPGHARSRENSRITKQNGGYRDKLPKWCPLLKGKPYRMV